MGTISSHTKGNQKVQKSLVSLNPDFHASWHHKRPSQSQMGGHLPKSAESGVSAYTLEASPTG